MAITYFRAAILRIVPRWLQGTIAGQFLYSIGVHVDAAGDHALYGVKRRFPGLDGMSDALGLIGKERKIRRGPGEASSTYAARLRGAFDAHRTRGGPYALLKQVHAYYAADPFEVMLVYRNGKRFTMDLEGKITRDFLESFNPVPNTGWAQWWMFYRWPTSWSDDGVWGVPPAPPPGEYGTWGDGGVWGSDLDPEVVRDVILVPAEWNAAHCVGRVVLTHGNSDLDWRAPVSTWTQGAVWGDGQSIAIRVPEL